MNIMAYFEVTHREQIQSLLPLLISFQIFLATLYGFKLPPRLKEKHVWESVYSSWVKQVQNCIDTFTFYHDRSVPQPHGIWCHSIEISSIWLSFRSTMISTIGWLVCAFSLVALLSMVPLKNSSTGISFQFSRKWNGRSVEPSAKPHEVCQMSSSSLKNGRLLF